MQTLTAPLNLLTARGLTAISFLILLTGCFAKDKPKEVPVAPAAVQAIPVDAYIVKPASFSEQLEITGTLVANQQVDIVSELTRKIVRVQAKEGHFVKAGTLLFQLDDADLQAQLERLRQQEKLARLNEERLRDLIQHEAVIQQDYDQAFTNLKVLQAQINELLVLISKTRIKAPFDGQIGIIHAFQGAIVSTNTVLTNIQDNSTVKVEFSMPEKYANAIAVGSEQPFTVASDTKQYKALILARESKLDLNTRTLLLSGIVQNPGRVLLPGQSARLLVSLHAASNALMVSSQSLIPSSQGYSVFIAKNNHVQLSPVEIGQRSPYAVEILKGLSNGDTVVTSNLLRLTPNAAIQFVTLK